MPCPVHIIQLLEFPWTFTYQTSQENNNNKDMNDIFYHITSASLSWNPFIHFLHTIHSIHPPDIVTGWHILCLIYFVCTIQALIKQEQIYPHSWCHYTKFHSLHPRSVSIRLYHWPEGQGPFPHLLCGDPDTYVLKAAFLDRMLSVPPRVLTNGTLLYFIF